MQTQEFKLTALRQKQILEMHASQPTMNMQTQEFKLEAIRQKTLFDMHTEAWGGGRGP